MNVFSSEWAEAYKTAVNQNNAYRASSEKWQEGAVALVLTHENGGIAVLIDLLKGECLGATSVSPSIAHEKASFVIEADIATWQEVLGGNLQPLMGIMRGKLKLAKGSLARLIPYTKAANELVNSAQTVPTTFE